MDISKAVTLVSIFQAALDGAPCYEMKTTWVGREYGKELGWGSCCLILSSFTVTKILFVETYYVSMA